MSSAIDDPIILSKLQPKEFYKKWMEKCFPTRPDQRNSDTFRPVTLQIGTVSTAESSSTVKLGNTIVVGAIKLEVAEPLPSSPSEGFVVTNVTLCAGCSPTIRSGPPTDQAQKLTNRVATLLKKCKLIEENALVIESEKLVWVIHLDLFVINDAGNVFDAVWIALLATLKNLVLPEVTMDEDTGMIHWNKQQGGSPLRLTRMLLPLTFIYLPEYNALLADPTDSEEAILGPKSVEILINPLDNMIHHCESTQTPQDTLGGVLKSESVKNHLKDTLGKILQ